MNDFEYLWFECATCGEEFDLIIQRPEDIDACVTESGHEGHRFEICDYPPEPEL